MRNLVDIILESMNKTDIPEFKNINNFYNYFKNMGIFKEEKNSLKYKPLKGRTIRITKNSSSITIALTNVIYSISNRDRQELEESYTKLIELIEEDKTSREELNKLGSKKVYCVVYFTQSPVDGAEIKEMTAKDVAKFIEDYGFRVEVYTSKDSAEKMNRALSNYADNFDGYNMHNQSYANRQLESVRKRIKDRIL